MVLGEQPLMGGPANSSCDTPVQTIRTAGG